MTNYKIIVAYDGTDFYGWQRQPKSRTIQGEIEAALSRIAGRRIAVIGAGRTDAGVHARGQVANFRADFRMDRHELERALNAILPAAIRIVSLRREPDKFNARKSAKSKIYQYRIVNTPIVSPFDFRYVLHWPGPLDADGMARAAGLFVREADFSAFSSNHLLHPVRRVVRSEVRRRGREIVYTVEANGFLRYMVRTIVGTLLEVGRGRLEPLQVEEIFRLNERRLAGPTAPAKGLCLIRVRY
ncbi:MAG: tRNA pseudouridine(38-40) synthase TruA [Candidatus Aminicenantes bacterium RBG_16_63_16]|nr:MAG: tRNA pseudouridine(38-40) synthase TruA [Candidatus Aminicenantes bacterium RBG_16_63_16]